MSISEPERDDSVAALAFGGGQPLTDAERKVWHAFVDGGWALMAQITSWFSTEGMSVTEMRLLEIVAERDSAGISELAGAMHSGVSTISRVVGRLIEQGFLERVPSQSDARHRLVRITDSGRDEMRRRADIRDAVIRRCVIDVLTPEEFELLGDMFNRIRDASR